VLFLARSTPSFPSSGSHNPLTLLNEAISQVPPNIDTGTPYSDLVEPETVAVLSQPQGQTCAVVGGIMAIRMAKVGVKAVLVDGRVRDQTELANCGVPVRSSS
jgi:regulator of RNase E activity RraA